MIFSKKFYEKEKLFKMSTTKPICKFGDKCFRKNPEHVEKFDHSPKGENSQSGEHNNNSVPKQVLPPLPKNQIYAKDFFKSAVGMGEKEFRERFGFNNTKESYKFSPNSDRMSKLKDFFSSENGRCQLNFKSQFVTVQNLIDQALVSPKKPIFKVLFSGNVQTLMAHPENKCATFMVASTPFGLEGAAARPEKFIEGYTHTPVQGEWCGICCPQTSIYEKYFRSECFRSFFQDITEITTNPTTGGLRLDLENLMKTPDHLDNLDISYDQIAVRIDSGVQVMHGKIIEYGDIPAHHILEVVDDKTQKINLVFTSAIDFGQIFREYKDLYEKNKKQFEQLGKAALKAAFVGSALAAQLGEKNQVSGRKRLFLTLPGGGAFRNPLSWISEAINSEEFKNASLGLEIILVFQTAKKKFDLDENPMRTPEKDFEFLKRIDQIFNCPMFEQALKKAYGKRGIPLSKEEQNEVNEEFRRFNRFQKLEHLM